MASIKCKYVRHRCVDGTYEHHWDICHHHETWGGECDELCEYCDCEPVPIVDNTFAFPMQCRHLREETVMFEKNVKSFELDGQQLKIGRLTIDADRIKHLTIDGEVVIAREEHEETA